jgi:hypothetical protein
LDAGICVEETENGLGIGRAARTCDADCDDLAAGFCHG